MAHLPPQRHLEGLAPFSLFYPHYNRVTEVVLIRRARFKFLFCHGRSLADLGLVTHSEPNLTSWDCCEDKREEWRKM